MLHRVAGGTVPTGDEAKVKVNQNENPPYRRFVACVALCHAGAGDKIDAEFYHCAKAVDANHKLCLTSAKTDSDAEVAPEIA